MLQEKLQLVSELHEKIFKNDIKCKAEQQIEKTQDRASYPRARNDATKLFLAIEDGQLGKKETLATILKESDKKIDRLF